MLRVLTPTFKPFLEQIRFVVSWMDTVTSDWIKLCGSHVKRESVQQPTFFQDRFDFWVACVAGAWK